MKGKNTCVILLSDKSSGSSAIQRELIAHPSINMVTWTTNAQNETLFWILASSILKRHQVDMLYSNLPIEQEQAKSSLVNLLKKNGIEAPESHTSSWSNYIFNGWNALCEKYEPVFFEKSPHHLHNWSSLELILEFKKLYPETDVLFLGLIRNPMDTIYSHWTRWRVDPIRKQYEWVRAYNNLLKLKDLMPETVHIVRYEDLVANRDAIDGVFQFIGLDRPKSLTLGLHNRSISKWKEDYFFGFNLSIDVRDFARKFGYTEMDLGNEENIFWPVYRFILVRSHRYMMMRKKVKKILRAIKKKANNE